MRKWRCIPILAALGFPGVIETAVQAQVPARPADPGAVPFPYTLPAAPLPGSSMSGPTLPAVPVGQLVPMPAQPAQMTRQAQQPRASAFADQGRPTVMMVQNTAAPAATVPATPMATIPLPTSAPMTPAPMTTTPSGVTSPTPMAMPGTPVGSAPTGGLPSPPSSAIFPSPVDSGATTGQQFTSAPGQESRQPVNPASDPGNFSAVWLNGMNFTTPNKDWVIHLGGRLQFENVLWSQPTSLKGSPPGNGGIPAATPTSGTGVGALDDGMFFRRVRLRSDGTGYGVVEYQFEVDFEQLNYITYDNLWVGFKDVPFLGTVRVGQHKVPQGLEMIGSDYHLTFLERSSLADAFWTLFAPGIFVSNSYLDKNLVVQTMFHRVQPTQFYNEDFGDGNYASTSRVTYTPIYADDGAIVLHVGGSYQFRTGDLGRTIQPGGTGSAVADRFDVARFRARPEIRDATGIGSVGNGVLGGDVGRFVDTGFLLASNVQTCSPEFLLIYGPFSVQAEGAWSRVADARSIYPASAANRDRGNPTFWGGYVQASYFLTGEHRGYDRRMATFDRPKVANNFDPRNLSDGEECDGNANPGTGGWGAWEIGYRFSYLDLNDNGINGGLLRQHTLGLNWYFNDNFKIQANFVNINRSVPRPANSGTVNGFGMLAQWYF